MVKILLIRHGQSMSNYIKDVMYDNTKLDWNSLEFKLQTRASEKEEMVDSILTEKGKMQCALQREKEKVALSNVKHMFVSPFSRCLETTRNIFDVQEILAKGGSLVVRQELREMLCCQSDIPSSIMENMQQYPAFDFSEIEDDIEKFKELFFVRSMEDGPRKSKIVEYARSVRDSASRRDKDKFMINLIKEDLVNKRVPETRFATFTRISQFKKSLKQIIDQKNLKDGEVAVVAHYGIIRAWTCSGVDQEKNRYLNAVNAKNCQIIDYELND